MSRRYRKWVEEYQNQAWSLARYLLKDPQEAEDACQEAFVKLWRHQDSIDQEKIRPWLMKVTRNECLDRLRRRRPTEELTEWRHQDESPGPMQPQQPSRADVEQARQDLAVAFNYIGKIGNLTGNRIHSVLGTELHNGVTDNISKHIPFTEQSLKEKNT